MKYRDMTPEQAEKRRAYLRDRHKRIYAKKKDGTWKSKYRFINDGDESSLTAHKAIVEKAIGKRLPSKAQIHHVDGDGLNNRNDNLVVCPDSAYHMLLHRRQKALDECGDANWMKCVFCKQYDDPKNLHLYVPKEQTSPRANHSKCSTRYTSAKRKEVVSDCSR